jgi:single-strand DNA-binding protein
MAGLNKVFIIGNLGRDPELRYTQTNRPVTTLNVATTRSYTNADNQRIEETEWHRVVVWGAQAEHCNKYLAKGRQVHVEGRLQTRSYEDKDGVTRYSTEVVAEWVQFLGQRPAGADREDEGFDQRPSGQGNRNQGGNRNRNQGGNRGAAPGSIPGPEPQRRERGSFEENYVPAPGDDDIPF